MVNRNIPFSPYHRAENDLRRVHSLREGGNFKDARNQLSRLNNRWLASLERRAYYNRKILAAKSSEQFDAVFGELSNELSATEARTQNRDNKEGKTDVEARAKTVGVDAAESRGIAVAEAVLDEGAEMSERGLVSRVRKIALIPSERKKAPERKLDYAVVTKSLNDDPDRRRAFAAYLRDTQKINLSREIPKNSRNNDVPEALVRKYYKGFFAYRKANPWSEGEVSRDESKAARVAIEALDRMEQGAGSKKEEVDDLRTAGKRLVTMNSQLQREFGRRYGELGTALEKDPNDLKAIEELRNLVRLAADRLAFQQQTAREKFAGREPAPSITSVANARQVPPSEREPDDHFPTDSLEAEIAPPLDTPVAPDATPATVEAVQAEPAVSPVTANRPDRGPTPQKPAAAKLEKASDRPELVAAEQLRDAFYADLKALVAKQENYDHEQIMAIERASNVYDKTKFAGKHFNYQENMRKLELAFAELKAKGLVLPSVDGIRGSVLEAGEPAAPVEERYLVQEYEKKRAWLAYELALMLGYTGKDPGQLMKQVDAIAAQSLSDHEREAALNTMGLSGAPLREAMDMMHAGDALGRVRAAVVEETPSIPELSSEQVSHENEDQDVSPLVADQSHPPAERVPFADRAAEVSSPEKAEVVLPEGLPAGWEQTAEAIALTKSRSDYTEKYGTLLGTFREWAELTGKDAAALIRKLENLTDGTTGPEREAATTAFLAKEHLSGLEASSVLEAVASREAYLDAKHQLSWKLNDLHRERIASMLQGKELEEALRLYGAKEIFDLLILKENRELATEKVGAYPAEKQGKFMRFAHYVVDKVTPAVRAYQKLPSFVRTALKFSYVGAMTAIRATATSGAELFFAVGGRVVASAAIVLAREKLHGYHEKARTSKYEKQMGVLRAKIAEDPSAKNLGEVEQELIKLDQRLKYARIADVSAEVVAMGALGFLTGQGMRQAQQALFHAGAWENFMIFMSAKHTFLPGTSQHNLSGGGAHLTGGHGSGEAQLQPRTEISSGTIEERVSHKAAALHGHKGTVRPVAAAAGTPAGSEIDVTASREVDNQFAAADTGQGHNLDDFTGRDFRADSATPGVNIYDHDYAGSSRAALDPHDYAGPAAPIEAAQGHGGLVDSHDYNPKGASSIEAVPGGNSINTHDYAGPDTALGTPHATDAAINAHDYAGPAASPEAIPGGVADLNAHDYAGPDAALKAPPGIPVEHGIPAGSEIDVTAQAEAPAGRSHFNIPEAWRARPAAGESLQPGVRDIASSREVYPPLPPWVTMQNQPGYGGQWVSPEELHNPPASVPGTAAGGRWVSMEELRNPPPPGSGHAASSVVGSVRPEELHAPSPAVESLAAHAEVVKGMQVPQVLREMQFFDGQNHELSVFKGVSLGDFLRDTPMLKPGEQGSVLGRELAGGLLHKTFRLADGATREIILTPRQAILRSYLENYREELLANDLGKLPMDEFVAEYMKAAGT